MGGGGGGGVRGACASEEKGRGRELMRESLRGMERDIEDGGRMTGSSYDQITTE